LLHLVGVPYYFTDDIKVCVGVTDVFVVLCRREFIVKEQRCSGTARRISVLFQNLKDSSKEPAQFKYLYSIKDVQQNQSLCLDLEERECLLCSE
jgi:hypothetical protein